MDSVIPVLWICGAPGVGKTTVAWRISRELVAEGCPTGYVDIDQLGICYPESPADPDRHHLKARNLDAVVATFGDVGARNVVVSGVAHPALGVHTDDMPHARVTLCRLTAEYRELALRYVSRGSPSADVARILSEAELLDASAVGDVCIDTSGLDAVQAAIEARSRTGWPPARERGSIRQQPAMSGATRSRTDGRVTWLSGVTGTGKSTVGFALFRKLLAAGATAAYLDLDQLAFCDPAPSDDAKAHLVARIWNNFLDAGAVRLVVVGPVRGALARATYADALTGAEVDWFQLSASPQELTARILGRAGGGSWRQPGDPLIG